MKFLDVVLNLVTILAVAVVLAYVGLHFDTGLFTVLPEAITSFFLQYPSLLYVTLVVLVVALVAKAPVGRAIKRQGGRSRV